MTKYLYKIIIALILCISLPIAGLETYIWQHCLFPPSGPNVEVIVSACDAPRMYSISPDGKYILYLANYHRKYQPLLMDTTTGNERSAFAVGQFWLSNTLFVDGITPPQVWIADISDESLVPLQWVQNMEGATSRLEDSTLVFSPEVVNWFRNAKQVYFISWHRWAIALGPDFKNHPERNFILATPSTSRSGDEETILKFLKDNQITYIEIGYPDNSSPLVSHNGRFMIPFVGSDGFYTPEGTRIGPLYGNLTEGYHECCVAYGWAYDDSGIYVQGDTVGAGGMFPYPAKAQPIIKLHLPSEYLAPVARQTWDARQDQVRMILVIRGSILFLLLIVGLWFLWRRKKMNRETV